MGEIRRGWRGVYKFIIIMSGFSAQHWWVGWRFTDRLEDGGNGHRFECFEAYAKLRLRLTRGLSISIKRCAQLVMYLFVIIITI